MLYFNRLESLAVFLPRGFVIVIIAIVINAIVINAIVIIATTERRGTLIRRNNPHLELRGVGRSQRWIGRDGGAVASLPPIQIDH